MTMDLIHRGYGTFHLSLRGTIELACRRGLTSWGAWHHYHNDDPAYASLDYVRVEITRSVNGKRVFQAIDVHKARLDAYRNAGLAWRRHPLMIARTWAYKIALSETFGFPLESADGSEWAEILESIVEVLDWPSGNGT
jgi:hypothetical protein